MSDHHEAHSLELEPAAIAGELLEQVPPTDVERRFAELRDPDGETFVSPLGDRRERPVPCRRCRRIETFALRAVCVPCLERDLVDEIRSEVLEVLTGCQAGAR